MKRSLIVILLICLVFISAPAFAFDFLFGAKASYVVWKPILSDMGKDLPWMGWQYFDKGSGFMYGGNLGLIITDDISLSVSYLYGNLFTQFDKRFTAQRPGNPGETSKDVTFDTTAKAQIYRHDLDSALSYNIISSLKIFAGFKYQPLSIKINETGAEWELPLTNNGRFNKENLTIKEQNYAPAVGIGYSLPFAEVFAFTANLSFLYMWGTMNVDVTGDHYSNSGSGINANPSDPENFKIKFTSKGFGFNFEPAFVFFVKESVVLVLGGRIQFVRSNVDLKSVTVAGAETPSGVPEKMKNLNDILYGGYVSIMYKI